jgi:hypothetical protein
MISYSKNIIFTFSVLILFILLLIGCSTVSNRIQTSLTQAIDIGNSITCHNNCKQEWERAQIWLAKHSKWKIQTVTDVLIQTFYPVGSEPSYGFSITKEPAGQGNYIIRMELVCGNMFGCDPKPQDVKKAFYYYIKNGVDLLPEMGNFAAIR